MEATDSERRRLERNLHDGAQQRLVALSLSLRLVRSRVEAEPGAAAELLDECIAELLGATSELRELACLGPSPAIVLTSSHDREDFGESFPNASAAGFVPKDELSGAAVAALVA